MSYKTYITEALVLGSENRHTSDRSFLLFTREAGMLFATARSVREERWKQRYALQDFTYARLTLVRGKAGWRIAGAEAIENMYFKATTREARGLLVRTATLLRRVIRGESPHTEIFDDVLDTLRGYHGGDTGALELIFALRLLNRLGYVSPESSYVRFLEKGSVIPHEPLSPESRKAIEDAVEHALLESQL